MKQIEQLQEQIQNDIRNAKVSEESFDLWQSNEVTKLFMATLRHTHLEALASQPIGNQEQVFIGQIQRKAICDLAEQFLEWNPLKD